MGVPLWAHGYGYCRKAKGSPSGHMDMDIAVRLKGPLVGTRIWILPQSTRSRRSRRTARGTWSSRSKERKAHVTGRVARIGGSHLGGLQVGKLERLDPCNFRWKMVGISN